MKTKEELNALKEEVEALNKKLAELTEEELAQVTGGNRGIWSAGACLEECGVDPAACSAAKENPRTCHKLRSGLQ